MYELADARFESPRNLKLNFPVPFFLIEFLVVDQIYAAWCEKLIFFKNANLTEWGRRCSYEASRG